MHTNARIHKKTHRFATPLTAATLACMLGACGESNDPSYPSAQDVKEQTSDAAHTATEFAQGKIDTYKQTMRDNLEEIDAKIESLQQRASQRTDDARTEIDQAIDALEQQRERFVDSIENASADSAEAFTELKSGLDKAWNELRTAASNAADRFDD